MDIFNIAKELGLADNNLLIQKAAEFRRLYDAQFDSSIIGVGEICKAVIYLEITASRLQVIFDRQAAIKRSDMSERDYSRLTGFIECESFDLLSKLNIKELAIQFGCIIGKSRELSYMSVVDFVDVLLEKRKHYDSSQDEHSCYKRPKKIEENRYEDCKSIVANSSEA